MSDSFLDNARATLLQHLTEQGVFAGQLSSSALSTATASLALALTEDPEALALARGARRWLARHQNPDGGWGDTTDSPTNVSTTVLCWAALNGDEEREAAAAAEAWLERTCGGLTPEVIAGAIRARYGKDQTFSIPILLASAISGRLGDDGWRLVPPLPFELAVLPHGFFKLLNLRMVSYALPALIAVGQAIHFHRGGRNPLRLLARKRTLEVLNKIQPESGGFLEAAPLTSFVSMSLLSMGLSDHPVTRRCIHFLKETVREDGSWPIDTNLDTWTTTLAVNALGDGAADSTTRWLVEQQYTSVHPYTMADPGGWAWTDLPGGVPDADDTSGALLALRVLAPGNTTAAAAGVRWLLSLQNRDGGIPTFCKGWGKLPFDQSCPDITAHALRAWAAWVHALPELKRVIRRASQRAVAYLAGCQKTDGSWVPLWFGNQQAPDEENPLYGTTRVLLAGDALPPEVRRRAMDWLLKAQGDDGGFGAAAGVPPSIEETALAVEALDGEPDAQARAVAWLQQATDNGTRFPPSPIGLYFAKLWYSERLYPIIFTVSALQRAKAQA